MNTYLGIDYGRAHVGLAIALSPLAEPLEVTTLGDCFGRIQTLVKLHDIKTLVVGLSEGDMAKETQRFAQRLKEVIGLPVVFHDETLTSYAAQHKLRHKKKKDRQGPDHHYAAALILQDYLDSI